VTRLTDDQLTVAWQAVSLVLDYPDQQLLDRLDLLDRAAGDLPKAVGVPLRRTVTALADADLFELEREYVETFDQTKRHSLFLTWFAYGDTRRRGQALLRFRQTYRASGFEDSPTELPDHLCVVLEYAATIDQDRGRQLMLDHRAGLEVLRLALTEAGSRWAGAVQAVCGTLPPLRGDEHEAIRRLAAEGPPEEEVGLAPYPTGPTLLPVPSVPPSKGAAG
jgi:nitrate reductase molybdenum cofactor assembly chaperone NarJ/NarW